MESAAVTTTAAPPTSVAALLRDATTELEAAGIDTARLEAELLLAHACGWTRAMLWARLRDPVPATARDAFDEALLRRRRREPFQYIIARQELWSLDFVVTPDVLIPRPETEVLIEVTLAALRARGPAEQPLTLCDVGTGSGCIAIALARELPAATVWAIDASLAALRVARLNAARFGVADRIRFIGSDLLTAVPRVRVDALVANPPYVRSADLADAQPELAWEPRAALDGGPSGLDTIERLVRAAATQVRPGGLLAVEIGAEQGPAVRELAVAAGWNNVTVVPDYGGRPRVLQAEA
jgi:release factor glutamine methyltransferase